MDTILMKFWYFYQMTKEKYEIKWIPTSEVVPANYNPRAISAVAFEGLKKSIQEFGMPQPIIINTETNTLVSGHQRLKAARELELDKIPVVYVNISEKMERALNVTMNNKNIEGFFTDDIGPMLDELKMDIPELYFDLKLDALEPIDSWEADKKTIDDIEASDKMPNSIIKITCPHDLKDEVLIFIKSKFLETSFEGVHIE